MVTKSVRPATLSRCAHRRASAPCCRFSGQSRNSAVMPSVECLSDKSFLQMISHYMKGLKLKRNNDLRELFLGNCQVGDLCDLQRFRYLKYVWLHDNKLTQLCIPDQPHLSFIHNNFRIAELYLHDNDIKSVHGMLRHLPCLKVLMLQKNQLVDLDETTQELKPLMTLQVLNMLYNPLSQVKGYRLHLIHNCPSIQLLDRQEVTLVERKLASEIYEEKKNAVKAMIAFGRKADGPPIFEAKPLYSMQDLTLSKMESITTSEKLTEVPSDSKPLEQLIKERTSKKSMMEYTTLDWSLVPTRQQRINGELTPKPQNITVRFR